MHVAENLPVGADDVIDYVMSAAPTVGDGLRRVSTYGRLIDDQSELRLVVETGSARVAWDPVLVDMLSQ